MADAGYPDAPMEDVLSYALFPEVALPFFAKRKEMWEQADAAEMAQIGEV